MEAPQPHMKGVTCIVGIMISQTIAIIASTSSDGTVFIWEMILPSSIGGMSIACLICYIIFSCIEISSLLVLYGAVQELGHSVLRWWIDWEGQVNSTQLHLGWVGLKSVGTSIG